MLSGYGRGMTSTRETELKFDGDEAFRLPALEGLTTVAERDVELRAVYWDTDDLHLLGWGVTLRHRWASDGSEDGWTLKLPVASGASKAVVRQEISIAAPPDAPPDRLVDLVRGVTLARPLHPVATIATRRHIVELGTSFLRAALELADDAVESSVGDAAGPAFRQIEVELLDEDELATLDGVARDLLDAGLRTSEFGSKLEHVLGRPRPRRSPERNLGPRSTIDEFVRALIARDTSRLIENDPAVRLGDEPEAVHRARVATRRLRAELKSLRPVLVRTETDRIRGELSWLAGLLGDLRDTHVLRANLDAVAMSLDDTDEADRAEIDDRLREQCEYRRAPLASAMSGDRYVALLADLTAMAEHPPFRKKAKVDARALPLIRDRAADGWKKIRRSVRELDAEPSDVELHDLRKAVKQVRYSAQAARLVGASSKTFTRQLGELQETLGELHDSVVAMAWLRDEGHLFTASAAFLAGRIHHEADARRRAVRVSWRSSWAEADEPTARRWMRG